MFGQSWAQELDQRPRLDKCYINQRNLIREIDSNTFPAGRPVDMYDFEVNKLPRTG